MAKKATQSRDDFSQDTLRKLAGRAGYMCSMPGCNRLTIGPSDDRKSGLTNVGVGAHITAASAAGPRYNGKLTPAQRADVSNGIWVCQTHGKDIDDNASIYTEEELKRNKEQHEDWVYRRLSNGPSHIKNGVTHLRISNVGPFREEAELKFGRITVLLGNNGTGKTALCQAVSAFAGTPFLAEFLERFRLGLEAGDAFVEAGTAEADVLTKVRLTETSLLLDPSDQLDEEGSEDISSKDEASSETRRLLITLNEAVAPIWPVSRFPMLFLHEEFFRNENQQESFRAALKSIAKQFAITEEIVWSALSNDFFASTFYPCRFKRSGLKDVEICLPDRKFYLPPENLSRSEQIRIILALVIRLCSVEVRQQPRMVILDGHFVSRVDDTGLEIILKALGSEHTGIQLLIAVADEKFVDLIRDLFTKRWLGASNVGRLTAHAFI